MSPHYCRCCGFSRTTRIRTRVTSRIHIVRIGIGSTSIIVAVVVVVIAVRICCIEIIAGIGR